MRRKTKSTSTNPFRYISFTEQIANINADATRWQIALPTSTMERETFFYDAIIKWNDKDYGGYYKSFLEDIPFESGELRTYAQLLHHQKRIFDAVLKHLAIAESTSLVTIIELTIALARDLREDLSVYLWQLFEAIITLLEKANQQTELLESGFRALAVLFKLEWRRIVRELRRTFVRFIRLFASKRGYLRRFAAEAFAFLLRKSHSIGKLTAFLAETAEKESNVALTDGISQLYFNAVKGVMGQFHSTASQVTLEIVDSSLNIESEATRDVAIRILEGMMSRCASYARREHTSPIVDVLLKKFVWSSQSAGCQRYVVALSKLLLVWVSVKKGNSLPNVSALMDAIKENIAVDGWIVEKELLKLLSKAILTYCCEPSIHSTIVSTVEMISDKAESSEIDSVLDFFADLSEASLFDIWLMPSVGRFTTKMISQQSGDSSTKIFKFYAVLCSKRRPFCLEKAERIPFFDVSQHLEVRLKVMECICNGLEASDDHLLLVTYAVCTYPWLWRQAEKPQNAEALVSILRSSMAGSSTGHSHLALLASYAIWLVDRKLFSTFKMDELIDFVRKEKCSERSLRVLHMILPNTVEFKETDHIVAIEKIAKEIISSLGHWESAVRQTALEVLNLFDIPLEAFEMEGNEIAERESVFEVLLCAERTPLTLENYRRRLVLLRKISYGSHMKYMPKCENRLIETIPLRVIIAQLFERFTIYWPPLFEIIESYAYGLKIDIFWPIFASFIEDATKHLTQQDQPEEADNELVLNELSAKIAQRSPDYAMFRLQMFNLLSRMGSIAERRTKTLSPMLIALYREEYQGVDFMSRNHQDITWKSEPGTETSLDADSEEAKLANESAECVEEDAVMSSESENEGNIEENAEGEMISSKVERGSNSFSTNRKMIKRTIVALLETFSSFKTPKTVFMEREIRDLYDELLLVPDEEVQKAVLKCLFTYKYKFLIPYKENFENLTNGKTFLNELVRFGIDTQDSAIADEHRTDVIPLLMRLLYGKMHTHVASDATARRAAIFRFLAGCRPQELDVFIGVLFAPLFKLAGNDERPIEDMCSSICKSFDPTSMIPLAKIKGSLNSLSHVINKLSPSLADYQRATLYRLCLITALLVRLAMQCKANIHPKNIKDLKELRGLVCQRLKEIFFAFQRYSFTAAEINAIFKYFITPLCDDLSSNGTVIAPLGVLRLFECWTEVPTLFYLLRVRMRFFTAQKEETPISIMCNCLLAKSTNASSIDGILKAIINLLTFADEVNTAIPAELDLIEIRQPAGVNLGTALILSSLPKLLTFITESLPSPLQKKKINLKHLDILSRLGEFVDDATIGERLVSTLLAHVQLGALRSEEALSSLLLTVSRLIPIIKKPLAFLPSLVQQYSAIRARGSRDALCVVVDTLANTPQAQGRTAELLGYISDLNAWDHHRIDEPDYDRRHSAYNHLIGIWNSNEVITATIVQMIAHNHCFTIIETNDISLRAAASANLRHLIEYVGLCGMEDQDRTDTLEKHLLALIVKGLHVDNEVIRHEFVSALVSLIVAFPSHKELRHLAQLRNVDESDLDFFENIINIQIHRRQRALRRLTDSLEAAEKKIPVEILLRYVLPLIQPYVIELTSKTSALSDEAIRLLSYIMGIAPWKRYYPMLDFYMKRLQRDNINQKANVRIIVAIIDAFHFNVSSDDDNGNGWEAVKKIKKPFENLEMQSAGQVDSVEEQVDETVVEEEDDKKRVSTLGGAAGSSIKHKVLTQLLPKLKDCATAQDRHSHRKAQARKHYDEDDDIQRAPIALATVKLLKKMPQTIIDQHLHGVVLKLCSLLMSRSINVREVARKTIISVVEALGPKYLPFVVREMKAILSRGYQVHVMIFSIHALISAMQSQLSPGDLDPCLSEIMEVCNMDLFGDTADEKEVIGITKDVPEAKSSRTFDTYALLGRFMGPQSLATVLSPLKEVIESRPTAKTIKQVGQLLRRFGTGLCSNESVDPPTMLIFAFQTLKAHMEEVVSATKPKNDIDDEQRCTRREKSCLLLEKEPTRIGVISKTSVKSRMYIFVEFGLQILATTLKSNKLDGENSDDVARLDPFVSIVAECLLLKYDKVISNSLRCFISLLKYPLPSLRIQVQAFVDRLFILLADYAAVGGAGNRGVEMELNRLLFKAFTQMIKDAPQLVLSSQRLQLLLNYVEADVIDSQKQATAFPLIKAIVSRKLQDPKIVELMRYFCEVAITSELAHIRVQCRQVLVQFIGNHPQSKQPKHYVDFFIAQLEYEYEDGRVSAIEMLNSCFENFTEAVNDQYCLLALVSLGARLVNDDSAKCRRLIALAIRKLLQSISESKLNDAYLATRDWLQAQKEQSRCIAMQIIVEMAEVRGETFSNRFKECLPLITQIIQPVTLSEYAERTIVTILDSLSAMLRKCPKAAKEAAIDGLFNHMLQGLECFVKCLDSPRIQLACARLFGQLFTTLEMEFFHSLTDPSVKQLTEWMCWQLKNRLLEEDLAEQVAKNVAILSTVFVMDEELIWLCKKLCSICKFEVVQQPSESLKRVTIFKLAAALAVRADATRLMIVVDAFLPYLHREMMGKSPQNTVELQQISLEVAEIFKEKLGDEIYARKLTQCQKLAAEKIEQRKRRKKEEAVVDPMNAALKKQKKNKAKAAARKRKLDTDKPYRASIRKKRRQAQQ
uniref:DRIM domain-containing protein n=1 Tax=Parascaris univalens TaxID=6257 RepID=A0A915BRI6_PARUN